MMRFGSVLRLGLMAPGGRVIKKGPIQPTEVTNRPLNINLNKNFRRVKMGVKWIHKGGYSRPDKRTVRKGGKKK